MLKVLLSFTPGLKSNFTVLIKVLMENFWKILNNNNYCVFDQRSSILKSQTNPSGIELNFKAEKIIVNIIVVMAK